MHSRIFVFLSMPLLIAAALVGGCETIERDPRGTFTGFEDVRTGDPRVWSHRSAASRPWNERLKP